MTNPDYTHITLLVDRTGSMERIRDDAEGAVNAFINEHKKVTDSKASLLLIDFDGGYGDEPGYRVIYDGDIAEAPTYALLPRANTPLRDSIMKAIIDTGTKLAKMNEDMRPGAVIFVVQTDGQENASREFTQAQVIEAIKRHEDQFKWTFIFLATGPDAFSASRDYVGTRMMQTNTVSNTGGGTSHAASTAYLAGATVAQRKGAREPDAAYAAEVDDRGNVEEVAPD